MVNEVRQEIIGDRSIEGSSANGRGSFKQSFEVVEPGEETREELEAAGERRAARASAQLDVQELLPESRGQTLGAYSVVAIEGVDECQPVSHGAGLHQVFMLAVQPGDHPLV